MRVKVVHEYLYPSGGHHYVFEWELSDLYCPGCGSTCCVWHETCEGDYYVGAEYVCTHCEVSFTIQGPYGSEEPTKKLILEQLSAHATAVPTTRPGT